VQTLYINLISETILIVFETSLAIQLFYWLIIYRKVFSFRNSKTEIQNIPVSVIICAKNEEENLRNHLPLIMEQNYQNFEVIVVNDCSFDGSELLLNQFKDKYSNLYVTTIRADKKFTHGKKLALSLGIKAAKNEILILTDADCYPVSNNWIASIVNNYKPETEVILAYGGYEQTSGFLNIIIRYETLFNSMQFLTLAKLGIPYMGVGRNLSYKKNLWVKNKGFAEFNHILSGDDDLFVNKNANKKNTNISFSDDSITRSKAKKTFISLVRQKRRHFEAGKFYKFKHKIILGTEIFSRFLFYSSLIYLLIFQDLYIFLLPIFIIRLIIQTFILNFAAKRFKEKKVSFFIIIFDIIIPIMNLGIAFTNLFIRKRKTWN